MTWDVTTPAGTEAKSNGDNRIRELKTDIQTALRGNAADGTEAKFPGSDTANPVYRYRGLKGTTGARPTAGQYGLYINETLNTIQRDNGSTWQDVATLIPSGTAMVFYQASAPTGWTAVAVNDKFLRVVTAGGTGGTNGGTVAASTSLAHTHTVDSHTHTGPSHTHSIPQINLVTDTAVDTDTPAFDSSGGVGVEGSVGAGGELGTYTVGSAPFTGTTKSRVSGKTVTSTTGSEGTGATGGATPGTDSKLGVFAYSDVIVATKD